VAPALSGQKLLAVRAPHRTGSASHDPRREVTRLGFRGQYVKKHARCAQPVGNGAARSKLYNVYVLSSGLPSKMCAGCTHNNDKLQQRARCQGAQWSCKRLEVGYIRLPYKKSGRVPDGRAHAVPHCKSSHASLRIFSHSSHRTRASSCCEQAARCGIALPTIPSCTRRAAFK